jgi:hypothetical protein
MLTLINPTQWAEPFDHADWVFTLELGEAPYDPNGSRHTGAQVLHRRRPAHLTGCPALRTT